MMKKVLLVCVLVVALAGSASAANYLWNAGGYSAAGTNGSSVGFGVMSTPGVTPANPGGSFAAVASLVYTGGLDGSLVKTALYSKNWVADPGPSVWILQAWGGSDFAGDVLSVRIWASTASTTKPAAGWNLYKLYDPITQEWGKTKLNTQPLMATSSGNLTNPWFKADLPAFKTGTPLGAGQGYILAMEIPEPGSMVAMLSGLVGLVGFGIRRRR